MKIMIRRSLVVAVFALAAVSQAATWTFDAAHSAVSFSVKHMMIATVRGSFGTFDGSVTFDEGNPETFSVEAWADAASIDTRNEKRDAHLRLADFFDVEKYPQLTFKSKRVVKTGDGRYTMAGDLTIHGVTKETVFDVTGFSGTMKDPWGGTRTAAVATTTINRKDFGLNWNQALDGGGVVVSEDVVITLDVELVKKDES